MTHLTFFPLLGVSLKSQFLDLSWPSQLVPTHIFNSRLLGQLWIPTKEPALSAQSSAYLLSQKVSPTTNWPGVV